MGSHNHSDRGKDQNKPKQFAFRENPDTDEECRRTQNHFIAHVSIDHPENIYEVVGWRIGTKQNPE